MKMNNERNKLNDAIHTLQTKQAAEFVVLKEQFQLTYESIKPVNLIKSTFQEVVTSPEIQHDVISKVIGLASGYLSKKVLVGASHNPLKRILGTVLQFAIANIVVKHSDTIKSSGEVLLNRIFGNKSE